MATIFKTAMVCILYISSLNICYSAPGNLAHQPLFLGSTVPANIFFGIDDSGSMAWESLLNKGTYNPGNVSLPTVYNPPENYRYSRSSTIEAANRREYRRLTCHGYNVLAYNPNVSYTPWKGYDAYQRPYTDRTLATALYNPYSYTYYQDISNHVYFIWRDLDSDGEYDGPGSSDMRAPNQPATDECGDVSTDTSANSVAVSSLPVTLDPDDAGYPNSQQNYANWYSYYRKREYLVKRAISELIWNSNHRMGMATMQNNNNVGQPVRAMTDDENKKNLLAAVSQISSKYNTPLRLLLANTGMYFDQAGSNYDHADLGFTEGSPILSADQGGQCQQNFSILFSDGYWNGPLSRVGNQDGNNNSPWDGGSYADQHWHTLADVAMHYYETDLAPSLPDVVQPIQDIDENRSQHLNTFAVAFGVSGTLDSNPTSKTAPFNWPDPIYNYTRERVDDMRHAAWNGRGSFHNASKPAELIQSLNNTLAAIETRIGTSTSVTFNSNDLRANTQLYLTEFNSENWTGDLLAYNINNDGDIDSTPAWRASDYLDGDDFDYSQRVIFTLNKETNKGVPFAWYFLTPDQKNDLKTNPNGSISHDSKGRARLKYLQGDRQHEAKNSHHDFRSRASILGDIIHSSPTFVGAAAQQYPDQAPFGSATQRYSDFVHRHKDRNGIVYLGANDGIVHGFDSSQNGKEVLAYIPAELFSSDSSVAGLHYLTDPAYTHRYYNNHSLAAKDVFISSAASSDSPAWRTLLAGGYGAGGRGVFALDVTQASFQDSYTSARETVLWEFSHADSPHMGYSYSTPRIALLNNNQWALLFGNGYNSDSGKAGLLILFIEQGLDGDWSSEDFMFIDTGLGTAVDKTGLGEITTIDLDGDYVIDRVYGGDLHGRLWAFNLSSENSDDWAVSYHDGATAQPLFAAPDHQPITVKSAITRSEISTADNQPNVLVMFGSGQMLTIADPADDKQQSLYGIWDAGVGDIRQSQLVQQTLKPTPQTEYRIMTSHPVNYDQHHPAAGDMGWYFDLPAAGERLLVNPEVRLNQIFFTTSIPDDNECANSGGNGWLMVLDTKTGGESRHGAIDINADGVINSNDRINNDHVAGVAFDQGLPAGLGFLGGSNRVFITGTGSGSSELKGLSTETITEISIKPKGRLAWQELY